MKTTLSVIAALAGLLHLPLAQALEVEPGDAIAPPAGASAMALYLIDQRLSGAYAGGTRVADVGVHARLGVLRALRSTTLGGFHVNPQFALPFGRVEGRGGLDGTPTANGIGDLYTGMSVMLKEDPATRTSVYVMPGVTWRTGRYDASRLSFGNNRMSYLLQAGAQTALGGKLTVDGYADITAYGDNTDYSDAGGPNRTLSQKPVTLLQGYLRYDLGGGSEVALGARRYFGGERRVDGQQIAGSLGRTTAIVTASHWFAQGVQLMASLQRDTAIDNGLKSQHQIQVRVLKAFP